MAVFFHIKKLVVSEYKPLTTNFYKGELPYLLYFRWLCPWLIHCHILRVF